MRSLCEILIAAMCVFGFLVLLGGTAVGIVVSETVKRLRKLIKL